MTKGGERGDDYMELPGHRTVLDAVRDVLSKCAAPYSAEQAVEITRFIHARDKSRDIALEELRKMAKASPPL